MAHKWDGITVVQIDLMKHAIGFEGSKVLRKVYRAYRNYFTVNEPDPYWENLVSLGMATSRKLRQEENALVYFVTTEGKAFLSQLLGVRIIETD